jgi:hypothetical protein
MSVIGLIFFIVCKFEVTPSCADSAEWLRIPDLATGDEQMRERNTECQGRLTEFFRITKMSCLFWDITKVFEIHSPSTKLTRWLLAVRQSLYNPTISIVHKITHFSAIFKQCRALYSGRICSLFYIICLTYVTFV